MSVRTWRLWDRMEALDRRLTDENAAGDSAKGAMSGDGSSARLTGTAGTTQPGPRRMALATLVGLALGVVIAVAFSHATGDRASFWLTLMTALVVAVVSPLWREAARRRRHHR